MVEFHGVVSLQAHHARFVRNLRVRDPSKKYVDVDI